MYKAQKKQLEDILSSIEEVVWATRADSNQLIYTNAACYRVYGYTAEEMMRDNNIFFNAIHPGDRELFYESMQTMLALGRSESEFRVYHKDGSMRYLGGTARLQKGADGGFDICSGVAIDLTKLRLAELELQRQVKATENILDGITDGFFTLDRDWHFTYVNRAFERIYDCRREDLIGVNYWRRFPKARHQKFYQEYCLATERGEVRSFEEYATSLNKWVSLKVYPTADGVSVFFTDITEMKKLLEQTLRDDRVLKEQNERLREIAWIQSHKVRAPLANILGFVPLLDFDNPADKHNKEILEGIQTASEQLDAIIREISDKTIPPES